MLQKIINRMPGVASSKPLAEASDHLDGVLKELRAIAAGRMSDVAPQRMNQDELVKAGWGYLHVEEQDLTMDEARSILNSTP